MTAPTEPGPGQTIRSVETIFSIIDVLERQGGAGITELAGRLGHSKSTIHDHLRALEGLEYVVRDGERYRLSLRILGMADQAGNYDVIEDEVDALAEETDEIAQFVIEEHGKVSCLHKVAEHRQSRPSRALAPSSRSTRRRSGRRSSRSCHPNASRRSSAPSSSNSTPLTRSRWRKPSTRR